MERMAWTRVASVFDLPPGSLRDFRYGVRTVALCNDHGTVHAFDGECPHLHGPLGQGNLADGHLICPWHGWEFSCATGAADHNPSVTLKRYPVEIRDGQVFADLD